MSALFAICFSVLFVFGECGWETKKQDPDCVSDCIVCGTATCESWNYSPTYCPVLGNITSVELVNLLSSTKCDEDTYMYMDSVLTVKDGCRGEFKVCYEECPYNMEPIECESINSLPTVCKASESIYSVEILKQYSQSICQPDVNYSFKGNMLTVDAGCRAKFLLCVSSDWEEGKR